MAVANLQHPLVPAFDLLINGTAMESKARAHITSITVDDSTELPSMLTLGMVGSISLNQQIPWIDDQGFFAIGNAIEIKLGYGDNVQSLIVGEITGLEPEFGYDRVPSLLVRGYDRRHRLQRGRKSRSFVQKKDSDIASQIAGDAQLSANVQDSETVHDYVLQHNQTDLEFLQERARRIQYEVVVEDKTLLFRPVANGQEAIMTLTTHKSAALADDLLEFRPRLVSGGQVSEVSVRGWNPHEKKALVGHAKGDDGVPKMGGRSNGAALAQSVFGKASELVSDHPVMKQGEADQMAKAGFNCLLLQFITGEGLCRGRPDLRAGTVIKLDGVGQRFGGLYYVTAAHHRYSPSSGYETHFNVRRNDS
jgi:uncharacterized protein